MSKPDNGTLPLFEWRPPSKTESGSTQEREINRVNGRIGALVLDFCSQHVGVEFFVQELRDFVVEHQVAAPASPDRILRLLRQTGLIDYTVVDRSKSKYRVLAIRSVPQPPDGGPRVTVESAIPDEEE